MCKTFTYLGGYQGYPPRDNYRPDGYQGYNGSYSRDRDGGFKRGQSRGGPRGGACQLCTSLLSQMYYPQYCYSYNPIYALMSFQKLMSNKKHTHKQSRYQLTNW